MGKALIHRGRDDVLRLSSNIVCIELSAEEQRGDKQASYLEKIKNWSSEFQNASTRGVNGHVLSPRIHLSVTSGKASLISRFGVIAAALGPRSVRNKSTPEKGRTVRRQLTRKGIS